MVELKDPKSKIQNLGNHPHPFIKLDPHKEKLMTESFYFKSKLIYLTDTENSKIKHLCYK